MLDPSLLPPVCPTCGRAFVSWPSVSRHLRLDHTPEHEEEGLTVAEILAARSDDDEPARDPLPAPAPSRPSENRVLSRAREYAVRPWCLAAVVWLGVLYGLSHLGFGAARLVAWSFLLAVVVGALALRAWGRAELQLLDLRRRDDRRP